MYIADPTRINSADDGRLELEPHENIRALISNCPGGASTPGCVGLPYPSTYQTQARQVKITARVHPARPGVQVFFDIEDPPDTAPYGSPTPVDNSGGLGSFPGGSTSTSGTTDANGK